MDERTQASVVGFIGAEHVIDDSTENRVDRAQAWRRPAPADIPAIVRDVLMIPQNSNSILVSGDEPASFRRLKGVANAANGSRSRAAAGKPGKDFA